MDPGHLLAGVGSTAPLRAGRPVAAGSSAGPFAQALWWMEASLHARGVPEGRGGSCHSKDVCPAKLAWICLTALSTEPTPGVSAAPLVLYLDALVCEDALWHGRPLLRVPADYEKFFNTLQASQIDALQQGRGTPDSVRRLMQSIFDRSAVLLDNQGGLTPPVRVTRGVPQGSVSSPELSRAAQDPLLRIRAGDGAAYATSAGRRIIAAGFVDDIEHYGNGLADLPAVLRSLYMVQVLGVCVRLGMLLSPSWMTPPSPPSF